MTPTGAGRRPVGLRGAAKFNEPGRAPGGFSTRYHDDDQIGREAVKGESLNEKSSVPMTKFVAFAVDINGTALARYDLAATEQESAEQEARQYLEEHPVIEVWSSEHRRVARFTQDKGNAVEGDDPLDGVARWPESRIDPAGKS